MFDEKEIEELYDEFLNLDEGIFPEADENLGKFDDGVVNVNFMKKSQNLKNNNFIPNTSGETFDLSNPNTELDLLNDNFTGLNVFDSNKNSESTVNAAESITTREKPRFSASFSDKKENEFDNEFKEIDEKLTSPEDPPEKNLTNGNGWGLDSLGLWHSGPSSLNSGQSSNSYVGHQDSASSVSYSSYESQSQSTFSTSSKRTYSHQQLGAKVEMVYGLLSMLDTNSREDMSKTFLAMSSSPESCLAMRQSGCLPLLIQLIHSSELNKDVRQRAAEALHNIVHAQTDEKRRRREVRVLKFLQQIREYSDELKGSTGQVLTPLESEKHPVNAIGTLMKFSFDAEHRQAICTLGGLHAIAELIQVDYEAHGSTNDDALCISLRRYSGMSLTNLTFGDCKNKALLCSFSKFMCALVDQLKSPSEDLRQVTASVIRNLSWRADAESKQALRNVDTVTALTVAAMEAKKESTLKSILSALWNVSSHCSLNKSDICAVPGALAFFVNMLRYKSSSNTLAIVENSGGILRNISSHISAREDYRQILRDNNCFEVLLEHLKSPSLTIVSNACGTLWNLSARCPEDQKRLWEMGAISMLRSLVQSKHKMISMGSSAALKNLLTANPNENLLTHLDSTAKSLGLQNLPTLFVRKKKALEQELNITLAETCENIDPSESPTHPKPSQSESSEKKTNTPRRSDSRDSVYSTQSDSTYERINQITGKTDGKVLDNKNVTLHESLDEKSMPRKIENQKLMKRYKTSMIPTPKNKKMTQDRANEKTKEETMAEDNMNEETESKNKTEPEKPKKGIPVLNTRLKSKTNESTRNSEDCYSPQSDEENEDGGACGVDPVSEWVPSPENQTDDSKFQTIKKDSYKQEKNNINARNCTVNATLNNDDLYNRNSYEDNKIQNVVPDKKLTKKELPQLENNIVHSGSSHLLKSQQNAQNIDNQNENFVGADFENYQEQRSEVLPVDTLNLPHSFKKLETENPNDIMNTNQPGFSCQNTVENEILKENLENPPTPVFNNFLPEANLEAKTVGKSFSQPQTEKVASVASCPTDVENEVKLFEVTYFPSDSKPENEIEKPKVNDVELKASTSLLPKFKVGSPIMDSRVLQMDANRICHEIKKQQDFEMGCSLTSEVSLISCSSFLDTGDYSLFESSSTEGVDLEDSENLILRMASSKVKNFPFRKPTNSFNIDSVSLPSLGSLKNDQIEALDLDNSVLSVASITSEIAETYSKDREVLDSITGTYKVDPQNHFIEDTAADVTLVEEDSLNTDSLQHNPDLLDEECSLNSQENLPLDTCDESTPERMRKKLTPKEKRKTFHERYRTYTIRDAQGCANAPAVNHQDYEHHSSLEDTYSNIGCENEYGYQNTNEAQPYDTSTFVRVKKHDAFQFSKSLDKDKGLIPNLIIDSRSLNDLLTIGPVERKELVDNAKLVAFSLKTAVHEPEITSDSETDEPPKSLDIDTATYSKSLRDQMFGKISAPLQTYEYYEPQVPENLDKKGARVLKPGDKPDEKPEDLPKGVRGKRKPLYSSPHKPRANDLPSNSPKTSKMAAEPKKPSDESPTLQREGTFTKEGGPELKKRIIPVFYKRPDPKSSPQPLNKSKSGPSVPNAGNLKRQGDTKTSRIGRPLSSHTPKGNEKRGDGESSQRRPFSAGPANRTGGESAMVTKRPASTGLSSPKMRNSSSNQSIKSGNSPNSKLKSSPLQSSKSQSDASLHLVASKEKVSAGKPKPAKKEVTSKIASLWKKVEETKQKNQNVKDTRVWIEPEKTTKPEDEVLVIEQEEIFHIPSRKIVHSFTYQALGDDAQAPDYSQARNLQYYRKMLYEEEQSRKLQGAKRNMISVVVPPRNYNPEMDTSSRKNTLKVTSV